MLPVGSLQDNAAVGRPKSQQLAEVEHLLRAGGGTASVSDVPGWWRHAHDSIHCPAACGGACVSDCGCLAASVVSAGLWRCPGRVKSCGGLAGMTFACLCTPAASDRSLWPAAPDWLLYTEAGPAGVQPMDAPHQRRSPVCTVMCYIVGRDACRQHATLPHVHCSALASTDTVL